LKGRWVPHDTRDTVVDFTKSWSKKTEIPVSRFIEWLGTATSKFYDRPCYGLITEGYDGETDPPETVEAIAASMVERIRRVQPEGPYQLIGFSFGGLLAYEISRQLAADGQKVPLLAIVDAFSPNGSVRRSFWERIGLHLYTLIVRPGRVAYLRDRLAGKSESASDEEAETPTEISMARVKKVVSANRVAANCYYPGPYDGSILLIKPMERAWHTVFMKTKGDNGWSDVASGGVTIVEVPGTHNKMVDDQSPAIVDALRSHLSAD